MTQHSPETSSFRPLKLVATVLLLLLGISLSAQWYASNITLPRYCEDPEAILARVEPVLTDPRPAGDGDRKPYIIAARLTFLVPRAPGEELETYLFRLQRHLHRQCR